MWELQTAAQLEQKLLSKINHSKTDSNLSQKKEKLHDVPKKKKKKKK